MMTSKNVTELTKYYPAEARHAGIEGTVVLAVTLDAQGRATNTLILSEQSADYGFGAAASTAAHSIVYDNPTGEPTQFTFMVRFELNDTDIIKEDVAPAG
jgi:TonB family protein